MSQEVSGTCVSSLKFYILLLIGCHRDVHTKCKRNYHSLCYSKLTETGGHLNFISKIFIAHWSVPLLNSGNTFSSSRTLSVPELSVLKRLRNVDVNKWLIVTMFVQTWPGTLIHPTLCSSTSKLSSFIYTFSVGIPRTCTII